MPFGLCNAPSTFQRLVNTSFDKEINFFILVYLEDILIYSCSIGEHWDHLRWILLKNHFIRWIRSWSGRRSNVVVGRFGNSLSPRLATRWKKCTMWICNYLGASNCAMALRKKKFIIIFVVPRSANLLVGSNSQQCASHPRNKTELNIISNTLASAHVMYITYLANFLDVFLSWFPSKRMYQWAVWRGPLC